MKTSCLGRGAVLVLRIDQNRYSSAWHGHYESETVLMDLFPTTQIDYYSV